MGGRDQWRVVAQVGGAPADCELVPSGALQAHEDAAGVAWTASGDHARFRLDIPRASAVLPAGWYEVCGRIECLSGVVTLPSLHPAYTESVPGDTELALPDPDTAGRVHTLVLFKHPVSALEFCPGVWPARFRLHGFVLRRVSRARALRLMLGGTQEGTDGGPGGTLRRAARFAAHARKCGVTDATVASFADYLRRQRPHGLSDYDIWIRKYDTLTDCRMAGLRRRASGYGPDGPSVSVLLPVQRVPEHQLRRCIDSVVAQVHPAWDLCVVAGAGTGPDIERLLEAYAKDDPRIRIMPAAAGASLAAMSNMALEMATGSHVAVFDTGDQLRPHALLEAADAICRNPDARLVYADEDTIDADGRRVDPYFKPDWNPDLLRSQNYIGHFAVIATAWVREVGGFRTEVEGAHVHDLFLRCTERLQPAQILHVPRILYHRGRPALPPPATAHAGSNAAVDPGACAVAGHLQRLGIAAAVERLPGDCFRVHWPLPAPAPKISLVIPTRDRVDLLRTCVESILARTSYPRFEIVVVDNQSIEAGTLDYLAELQDRDRVRVLRDDAPFNYSAINNRAVAQCDGELVCLVNNDIEVITSGWLEEMAGHAVRPEVGAVGAMLYYPDDTIQHAGVVVGMHGVADHLYTGRPRGYPGHGGRARVAQEMSAVTAACLLVRRDVYRQANGLDERLAVAFNDVDFCLRLRELGYRNIWTPFAELYHHESASRGIDESDVAKARSADEVRIMNARWSAAFEADPAYSRNLSLRGRNPGIAFPPRLPGLGLY